MRTAMLICLFPIFLFAQDYYESSGQTNIFTLKAGAKASPAAINIARISIHQATFQCSIRGNTLFVNSAKTGTLKLYTLGGRMLEVHTINSSGVVNLNRPLENGVYLLKFEANGSPVKTAKLIITESKVLK